MFLPHPSPKCFPVLIYLAKEVGGETHQTGNSRHSCCLHLFFFFFFFKCFLLPSSPSLRRSLGIDLRAGVSGKGKGKDIFRREHFPSSSKFTEGEGLCTMAD